MAYPGEKEGLEYKKYLEQWDLGEEEGERLSKDEWRKRRKQQESEKPSGDQPGRMSRIMSGT